MRNLKAQHVTKTEIDPKRNQVEQEWAGKVESKGAYHERSPEDSAGPAKKHICSSLRCGPNSREFLTKFKPICDRW